MLVRKQIGLLCQAGPCLRKVWSEKLGPEMRQFQKFGTILGVECVFTETLKEGRQPFDEGLIRHHGMAFSMIVLMVFVFRERDGPRNSLCGRCNNPASNHATDEQVKARNHYSTLKARIDFWMCDLVGKQFANCRSGKLSLPPKNETVRPLHCLIANILAFSPRKCDSPQTNN